MYISSSRQEEDDKKEGDQDESVGQEEKDRKEGSEEPQNRPEATYPNHAITRGGNGLRRSAPLIVELCRMKEAKDYAIR